MSKKTLFVATLIVFSAVSFAADAGANSTEATATASTAKKSARSIQYGFEERFRSESWNNIGDYNAATIDRRNQFRFRTRTFVDLPLGEKANVFAQFSNEFKKQASPDVKLDIDEGFVEALYLNVKDFVRPGLNLRIGRQPLMRGEGLILMEGTPNDGSRNLYFNAITLGYSWQKSTLELIGIYDPRRDKFLPRINNKDRYLTEWDEQALGLYYTDKNHDRSQWESYYFYKKEVSDYRARTNPQFQPDRYVHTFGGRLVKKLSPSVSAAAEAAFQFGRQHPDTDVRGWAAYAYVKKTYAARWSPYVQGGYWAMSGDDPKTTKTVEGWDPLFSRWPKWSDLVIYSQVRERGVSYWTNTHMLQAEAGFTPHPKLNMRATYYSMRAFHPFPGAATVFASGLRRGDLFQTRADFKFNDAVRGHLQYEALLPGSFYTGNQYAYFVRSELTYSFKGVLRPWKSQ